jgi:hypothetical protein
MILFFRIANLQPFFLDLNYTRENIQETIRMLKKPQMAILQEKVKFVPPKDSEPKLSQKCSSSIN